MTNSIRAALRTVVCGGVVACGLLRATDAAGQAEVGFARAQSFQIQGSGWGDAGLYNMGHGGWDASASGYGNFTLPHPLQYNAGNGGGFYGLVINDRALARFVQVVWVWDDDLTVVVNTNLPPGMVPIPAGAFQMGNAMDAAEGWTDELPLHQVQVGDFYMDTNEVNGTLWADVYNWATNHGYAFESPVWARATNEPVQYVCWYDVVKWCNARSEKDSRTPCYYTSAVQTNVYRVGRQDVQDDWVKWTAHGFRLPTEAEWEKAARGGAAGRRFPWGDTDTITHSLANYFSYESTPYDLSPTRGAHPSFQAGGTPYTNPAGSFPGNGYGLQDMAGNVWEWCWDWYDDAWYGAAGATQADTRGPTYSPAGSRSLRGGSWDDGAYYARCSCRFDHAPFSASYFVGFRCVW